jgi:hypothetical protein
MIPSNTSLVGLHGCQSYRCQPLAEFPPALLYHFRVGVEVCQRRWLDSLIQAFSGFDVLQGRQVVP